MILWVSKAMKSDGKAKIGGDLLDIRIRSWQGTLFLALAWVLSFGLNIVFGYSSFDKYPMTQGQAAVRATIAVLTFATVLTIARRIVRSRAKRTYQAHEPANPCSSDQR